MGDGPSLPPGRAGPGPGRVQVRQMQRVCREVVGATDPAAAATVDEAIEKHVQ